MTQGYAGPGRFGGRIVSHVRPQGWPANTSRGVALEKLELHVDYT